MPHSPASTRFERVNGAPQLRGLRAWMVATARFASSVVGVEAFWKSQGPRPDVPDSPQLWAHHRSLANRQDGKAIVLIGASRMRGDISVSRLRKLCTDYTLIQLGAAAGADSTLARELA